MPQCSSPMMPAQCLARVGVAEVTAFDFLALMLKEFFYFESLLSPYGGFPLILSFTSSTISLGDIV